MMGFSPGDAVCAPKKSQQLCDSVGTCKPSPGAHKACARGFFPREEPELTFRPWGLQREPNYFKETVRYRLRLERREARRIGDEFFSACVIIDGTL